MSSQGWPNVLRRKVSHDSETTIDVSFTYDPDMAVNKTFMMGLTGAEMEMMRRFCGIYGPTSNKQKIYNFLSSRLYLLIISVMVLVELVMIWIVITSDNNNIKDEALLFIVSAVSLVFFIEIILKTITVPSLRDYYLDFSEPCRAFSYGTFRIVDSLIVITSMVITIIDLSSEGVSVVFANSIFILHIVRTNMMTWMTSRQVNLEILQRKSATKLRNELENKWGLKSEDILLGPTVGSGGFGTVMKGLLYGTMVAVKILHDRSRTSRDEMEEVEQFKLEGELMASLRHPNVVLFMGVVVEVDKFWLVTEFCLFGSLLDAIFGKNITVTDELVYRWFLDSACGLAYLHEKSVCHRDLKLGNILISQGLDAKLADFGLSIVINKNEKHRPFAGTVAYSAPEVLRNEGYSMKADIYSFALCMWEAAARELVFPDLMDIQIAFQVVDEQLRPDILQLKPLVDETHPLSKRQAGARYIKLMQRCWDEDPEKRPSATELVAEFQEINKRVVESFQSITQSTIIYPPQGLT